MQIETHTTKTYDVKGLTEDQARDLLYFVTNIPNASIPFNGRQEELCNTLRQDLLNAGVKLNKVAEDATSK